MNMLSIANPNNFSRLVDELFESAQNNKSNFSPACDINESNSSYIINFEVPGVESSSIDVEVVGNSLVVKGSKASKSLVSTDSKSIFNERYYGEFVRSFSLPEDADSSNIKAHHKNGILTLEIYKIEKEKSKKIKIKIDV